MPAEESRGPLSPPISHAELGPGPAANGQVGPDISDELISGEAAGSPDRESTPFLDEVLRRSGQPFTSFHMPGHKQGSAGDGLASRLAAPGLHRCDLSEVGGIDYLHEPRGPLRQAQELAARAFGADQTFFLINGSTVGNQAAILGTVRQGQEILLPRASHRSVFGALMLSDAEPVYIPPVDDSRFAVPRSADIASAEALARSHPHLAAIHITSPSYYGICSDVEAFARLAHRIGVPLIVDEAHGAHFAFHPSLPPSALQCGADLVVQSTHKTLGSLTQSSMLHLKGGLVDARRIGQALALLQSSSPSVLLTVSLDSARAAMASRGAALQRQAVALAEQARLEIRLVRGLWCYGSDLAENGTAPRYDPTKLLIRVAGLDISGFYAARWLSRYRGIEVELCDRDNIVCTITFADTGDSCSRLVQALRDLSDRRRHKVASGAPRESSPLWPGLPRAAMRLPDAYFAPVKRMKLRGAIGQTCAEFVIPYPPGIPALLPGEIIEAPIVEFIERLVTQGAVITGAADHRLRTIRVVVGSK